MATTVSGSSSATTTTAATAAFRTTTAPHAQMRHLQAKPITTATPSAAHTPANVNNEGWLQQQQRTLAEQDKILKEINQSLVRLKHMNHQVQEHLQEDDKQLRALDASMDNTHLDLRAGIGKMKKLLRS